MTRAVTLALAVVAFGCGGGQPKATPPSAAKSTPNTITLAGGGSGYLVTPATPTTEGRRHAAVLVIQEWWGLNDWIKGNTHRFADNGYVALAVDLYRGKATDDRDVAHELMRGLPEDRAMRDIAAGFEALAARPDVDPQRIGIVGWCMGGGYALAFATSEPRLRAAVINYGRLVTDPAKLDAISAALLGNFAGEDKGIPPADVDAFAAALKEKGKDVDVKIYPGAGHAFMNPNAKQSYAEPAANDAWSRIDSFFARTLSAAATR